MVAAGQWAEYGSHDVPPSGPHWFYGHSSGGAFGNIRPLVTTTTARKICGL
jgi:hypothetical protein